jgi:hypothetical protein
MDRCAECGFGVDFIDSRGGLCRECVSDNSMFDKGE